MSSSSRPSMNHNEPTIKASDETTPLLVAVATGTTAETADPSIQKQAAAIPDANEDDEENVPLPIAQIFVLCYTRVVEPIAFFSIFPYINSMIENVGGIEKENVGFYSGLIESLFSAVQMSVMIFWGKAADRWGRKPVLAISLIGIALSTTLFGFSQSIWQMVVFRSLAGVFAGTLVTVRTMISENSTKYTQAKAFSYFAFAGNVGIFIGPLIGGALERPASKFKSTFGKIQFFHDYPYALPGFITGVIGLSAALVVILFARETLHIHKGKNQSGKPPMSTWQLLKAPGVSQVMLVYNYVMLLAYTYTAVNPVFMYTPISLGGLEFQPELIAASIGLAGASQAAWLLFAFPAIHKRAGTGYIFRVCAIGWPFFFAGYPICHLLLRYHQNALFWVVGITNLVVGSGVAMAFTASQLAINDIAPSHESLGTLNAMVLSISCGLRAIAPAIAASIYATGVKFNILGGQLFWILNIIFSMGLLAMLPVLPEKIKGKPQKRENGNA